MPTNVRIGINYLRVIRKPLDLAALFAASTRAVRQINRIENRAMPPCVVFIAPESQEDESRVRRVLVFNTKLSRQKSGHIHTIGTIMPRLMVASNNRKNLVRDGLNEIHHRRQFFHWREVYISIPKTRLQSAVEKIASQNAVRILMRVDIINVLAYSIVIRMRVSVMVVSKDK